MQHVELYVNEWTLDLGEIGREAFGQTIPTGSTKWANRGLEKANFCLAVNSVVTQKRVVQESWFRSHGSVSGRSHGSGVMGSGVMVRSHGSGVMVQES